MAANNADTVETTTTVTDSPDKVVPTTTVEPSPIEQEAIDQGWMPLEQWKEAGNDPADHRTAKEFVERGELYKSLSHTKGELKRTQLALGALQKHHQHVFEMAHQRAVQELKQAKRQAIRNEDLETAEALDEEIETLTEQHQQEKQVLAQQSQAINQVPVTLPPEWNNWKARNQWYENDIEMKDEADSIGLVYLSRRPGTPPVQVLEHVEREMKRRYPSKLGGRRAAPNAVAGVDRTNSNRNVATADMELDEMESTVMRQLVASGEMTEAQYKAELKKAKGIK